MTWLDGRYARSAALVAGGLVAGLGAGGASAQSGFDGSAPIPVYVTADGGEASLDDRSLEPTPAPVLDGLPTMGPVRVYVEPELIHPTSGLRVFGADLLEKATEELEDAFEKATRFEVAVEPGEAHLKLTLTDATETLFWDEVYKDPACFCLYYRLHVGEVDRSGTECLDNRGSDSWLTLGLDVIFGTTSTPSKESRPWESVAEQLVARLEAWLRGTRPAVRPRTESARVTEELKRALDESEQFVVTRSEADAVVVLRVLGSEQRSRRYEVGPRSINRTYYRVEVPGTGFADEGVESAAESSWARIAGRIVDALEHWVRENGAGVVEAP